MNRRVTPGDLPGPDIAAELEDLRARLAEAEGVLNAIRNGDVDAVVVSGGRGEQIYTLSSADRVYRQLIETMSEGAATLSADGLILYCNVCLAEMLGRPLDQVQGSTLRDYLPPEEQPVFDAILAHARTATSRRQISLKCSAGPLVPVLLSASCLASDGAERVFCLVLTNLTGQKRQEQIVSEERLARLTLEQAAEATVVCDDKGQIIRVSQAAHAFCDGNPLLRPFAEVFPLRTDAAGPFDFAPALRGEKLRNIDVALDRQGRSLYLILNANPLVSGPDILGCIVTLTDISERRRAEKLLVRVNRALKTLSLCNETLVHATDEARLLQDMCRIVVETGGYRMAWVGFAEHNAERTVSVAAQFGDRVAFLKQVKVRWSDTELGRGAVGTAIRESVHQLVSNTVTDPRFAPWRTEAIKQGYASALALPLLSDAGAFGALCIYAAERDAFDQEEIHLLSELANDLAFGIANLRLRADSEQSAQRLQRSMESTVKTIAATVEMRDPYTAGHQNRVAELAAAIARELGLPEDQVHGLHLASIVHDVGKINIPAEILSKPTRLTEVEYDIIKTHAQSSYDILKDVDFPWPIAEIVWQHHERLDGSGYPRGLKADNILIEARILAVADTVEAMSAARPYRPAIGIDAALKEVSSCRGTQYDAAAVDACLRLFAEKRFAFKDLREGARI